MRETYTVDLRPRPRRELAVPVGRHCVWYPIRAVSRLGGVAVLLVLSLAGWSLMTWLSLRLLSWLGVRP